MSDDFGRGGARGEARGPADPSLPEASVPRPRPRLAAMAGLIALTLLPVASAAQERTTPRVTFDAFGTLGVVHTTEDRADFVWNPSRPDGPGFSEEVSPDPDSRLGGQITLTVTPELTAVVQVVAEQDSDDDYDPDVEWANVRYAVTPDLSVRVGRFALPGFLVSEYRKVSYANTWVRPPVEVYGLIPVFSVDGVEASYRFHAGDWTTTLSASLGSSEADLPGAGPVESENTWNVNGTFQRGHLTGRLAIARGELDIDAFDTFFDAFRAFGPAGDDVADRWEVDDTPFEFATLGAEYAPGGWIGMAELAWVDFNSVLGEKAAGYVTGGRRLGPVTPYATYSRVELLTDTPVPGLSLAGLPPASMGAAAGLNAGLNGILEGMPVQQNVSVGGRWDVLRGMAVTLQVDFVDRLDASPGTFVNAQTGFERGGSARLFSLATSFVF